MTTLALLFGLTSVSFAIPQQLTQQGRLLDSSGAAIDGQHNLSFRIFDSGSGTNVLWEETITVLFNNGYYTALLGSDVASNPLEDSILLQEPLYLEVEVDNNGPLSPRQGMKSTPFARMAGTAESIDGGTVNASEISVGGTVVVDSAGSWVGPTIGMNWSGLSGIPADLADGDDDTLATINCSAGQILGWDGNAWGCAADNGLTESEVEAFVTNAPIDLAAGSQVGGLNILTTADQGESLADLSCQDGDLPKYDTLLGWQCSIDNDTSDWNALQNMPSGFADGIDNDTSDWNALQNIPSDFADGIDNDSQLSESQVEGFVTNGIGAFDLDAATTIGGAAILSAQNCGAGEILSFDGTQWNCATFSSLLDADQDGVLAWDDCDDNDPLELSNSYDQDCDGTLSADDCNDFDPASTTVATDADCDGVLTADDCNDANDTLLEIANDADCDGSLTANDCDDNNPNMSPDLTEICGDGIDNDCSGSQDYCFQGTANFSTCNNTGATGPTQNQCAGAYLGTNLENTVTLVAGIQQWTVPDTATYRIEAVGAAGGYTSQGYGYGALMGGSFDLNQGDVLHILVGQRGGESTSGSCDSSGGGGTFVALNGNPLIVAGGGGGGSHNGTGYNATITETAHPGCGTAGTNGNGGSGSGCGGSYAGGGGGFYTNGSNVSWGSNEAGGYAFLNGGEGAPMVNSSAGRGGFGGGSSGHGSCYIGGGAGGGYSGGGPGSDQNSGNGGGGGGSYNTGANQNNIPGVGSGDGSLSITLIQ